MAEFTLRRLTIDDVAALHAMDNDPDVMRWINGGLPISREQFEADVLPVYLSGDPDPFGFRVIECDGGFAGWVSLRRREGESAELGYRIPRGLWGRGLATSAAKALIDRGFDESAITTITATTYEENWGSQRVLEKLGFVLEQRFRMTDDGPGAGDTSVSDGELWDGDDLLYAIAREDWMARAKTAATS